jgi:hypothetical protein
MEEDLHVVLSELDSKLLVTMDVRRAVIVALDRDIAVGVQLACCGARQNQSGVDRLN